MAERTTTTTERNKALFRRLLSEVDRGNLAIVSELYDPAYVDHTHAGSRAAQEGSASVAETFERFRIAFPDTRHTVHALIAEDDFVVARVSATGTHTGPLGGLAPTQRAVTLTSTAIYRFAGGRIVERWCDNSPAVRDSLERGAGE